MLKNIGILIIFVLVFYFFLKYLDIKEQRKKHRSELIKYNDRCQSLIQEHNKKYGYGDMNVERSHEELYNARIKLNKNIDQVLSDPREIKKSMENKRRIKEHNKKFLTYE